MLTPIWFYFLWVSIVLYALQVRQAQSFIEITNNQYWRKSYNWKYDTDIIIVYFYFLGMCWLAFILMKIWKEKHRKQKRELNTPEFLTQSLSLEMKLFEILQCHQLMVSSQGYVCHRLISFNFYINQNRFCKLHKGCWKDLQCVLDQIVWNNFCLPGISWSVLFFHSLRIHSNKRHIAQLK